MKDTLFYLIYPALVAVVSALFSFFGSYRLQRNEKERENRSLKQDFIEKIVISLERLNVVLSKLSDDPMKLNYFSLQNIATAKPILQRLQLHTEDKLSLFQDQQFRSSVLNTIDEVTTVIEEIESRELNPVNKYTEHQNIVKETVAEYNAFRVKLLEMGFYLDANNEPQNLDLQATTDNANWQKLNQIRSIVQTFISKINNSQTELNTINQQAKELRSFLAVKLLNAQSKVKDLTADLNQKKEIL
ncbi:MAG: hypothetical protein KGJ58_01755 [Patescibacteria group bacterium]|nr:hypothetical protein [Patescibacteria group bacterium]